MYFVTADIPNTHSVPKILCHKVSRSAASVVSAHIGKVCHIYSSAYEPGFPYSKRRPRFTSEAPTAVQNLLVASHLCTV
ncbi:hypothetical protein CEXT_326771 [Caerostris extrusa]|uniref:Uncharacterized protein n=1 Tax=Caerostris extrusa TaxID=172846 RepID=A0AAV4R1K6_CAEEX|nr:hypothetical protein CEXT_326771 [Caerostris extrusa]